MGNKKKIILVVVLLLFTGAGIIFFVQESARNTGYKNIKNVSEKEKYTYSVTPYVSLEHVRSGLMSMLLKKNAPPFEKIRFNLPQEFSTLDDPQYGVFHPEGGKVKYRPANKGFVKNFMEEAVNPRWLYNTEFRVEGYGSERLDNLSPSSRNESAERKEVTELMAFLPGIKKSMCSIINKKYEVKDIPRLQSDQSDLYMKNMIDDGVQDYIVRSDGWAVLDHPDLADKILGCFESYDEKNFVAFDMMISRQ